MDNHTIREIGGEFFWELERAIRAGELRGDDRYEGFRWDTRGYVIDLMMAVLARHEGETMTNDQDIPVEPLPVTERYQDIHW